MFVKISDYAGVGSTKHRRSNNADLIIATDLSGLNGRDKKARYSLRISISAKVARSARIIAGDLVDVAFDADSTPQRGLLVRVNQGGWKICHVGGKETNKNTRLVFKVTSIKGMPTFAEPYNLDAVITDEGILFDLPPCSFTENLKKKEL